MASERDILVVEELSSSTPREGSRRGGVRRASLRIARGEVVAILGRSGSGKSALLGLCGGSERPQSGRVLVAGIDLSEVDAGGRESLLRQTIGWVFQSPRLVPLLTAEENVALAMRLAGAQEDEARALTQAALQAVGLANRAGQRASDLSRGERQRVALARALVKAPALVIADEPTAQLDSATADEILSLLAEAARSDVAVLFSTHDETEAARADRFLVMDEGILQEARRARGRATAMPPRPSRLPPARLQRSS
ncbi:MAG: ATP-binding cassette domain-containing protein [Candidatus Dormibacteraeota bacterium]|nr:ATP-binding cassette domain-containing protein [Candidatus Dormibacteraeota bacterium]